MTSQKITGYKQLTQDQVSLINEIKQKEIEVKSLIGQLKEKCFDVDQHWLGIGQTDIQKGFMSLVRSVARPD